jgi:hypothetical protein
VCPLPFAEPYLPAMRPGPDLLHGELRA